MSVFADQGSETWSVTGVKLPLRHGMRSSILEFLICPCGGDELQFSEKRTTWKWVLFLGLGTYLIARYNVCLPLYFRKTGQLYRLEAFCDPMLSVSNVLD